MAVAVANFNVGDKFVTQKSKAEGIITEIIPQDNGNVRVKSVEVFEHEANSAIYEG